MKDYSGKDFDEGKLYRVADKLRTLYSNINSEGRDTKFEQLLRTVPEKKRRELVG